MRIVSCLINTVAIFVGCIRGHPIIPNDTCGLNKYQANGLVLPTFYIVGGNPVRENAYPWMVSVQDGGDHKCGGTIINDQYVLTAAHCFPADEPPLSWAVMAGKQYRLNNDTVTQRKYRVAAFIRHEKYSKLTEENDITLIKLRKKITFTDEIQPACLPPKDIGSLEGADAIVTGWGTMVDGGPGSMILREVTVPIVSNEKCQQSFPNEKIYDGIVCAGYDAGGKDACQGDSGGPLVVLRNDGRYYIVGISSWGYGCAQPNQPGVYSRVSYFLDWIQSHII